MAVRVLMLALLLLLCTAAQGPVSPSPGMRDPPSACQSAEPERRTYEHTAPVRKKYYYSPHYRAAPPRQRAYVYRAYRRDTGPYHRRVWHHQPPLIHSDDEDSQESDQSGYDEQGEGDPDAEGSR